MSSDSVVSDCAKNSAASSTSPRGVRGVSLPSTRFGSGDRPLGVDGALLPLPISVPASLLALRAPVRSSTVTTPIVTSSLIGLSLPPLIVVAAICSIVFLRPEPVPLVGSTARPRALWREREEPRRARPSWQFFLKDRGSRVALVYRRHTHFLRCSCGARDNFVTHSGRADAPLHAHASRIHFFRLPITRARHAALTRERKTARHGRKEHSGYFLLVSSPDTLLTRSSDVGTRWENARRGRPASVQPSMRVCARPLDYWGFSPGRGKCLLSSCEDAHMGDLCGARVV